MCGAKVDDQIGKKIQEKKVLDKVIHYHPSYSI
jgi:hypothetical protein